jgi:Tol biopolymer transport system component
MKLISTLLLLLVALQLSSCSGSSETETPVVGPTGKILYTSGLKVYEYDIEKRSSTLLSEGEGAIRLKDGTILMTFEGDLVIKSADGSQVLQTIVEKGSLENSGHDEGFYQHLRVSPDGKRVAYYSVSSNEIYVVSLLNGTLLFKLQSPLNYANPSWLEDTKIIFDESSDRLLTREFSSGLTGPYDLTIIGARMPELSSDRQRMLVIRSSDVLIVEGSEVTQLTVGGAQREQAIFSPDDKWVAILTGNGTIDFYDREKKITISHDMKEHDLALQPGISW